MKNLFLVLLLVTISIDSFGQDTIPYSPTHSQIFSLSPISKRVDKVNGLVFGVGHVENKRIENQTINGLNVEVNPAPVAAVMAATLLLIYLPEIIKKNEFFNNKTPDSFVIENYTSSPYLKMNGLNLSTGCFFTTTDMNGLNISLGNKFKNFNGLSVAPLGTISDKINGLSIGIVNANTNLNGAIVGIYNQTYELKGLQTGLVNRVEINKGLQIGVYNRSYSRGLQLGVWNKNSRRSFPILNW
jgi:hypothetical protein